MPEALLQTKHHPPPPRPNLVPRLVDKLNVGLNGKLSLVSTPAGYGKTTLVAQWLRNLQSKDGHPAPMQSPISPADCRRLARSTLPPFIAGNRMDNEMKQLNRLFTLFIFTFLLLAACSRRTTPPGPDTIGGTVGGTSYTMLVWDEGLRILIWSDIAATSGSAGSGSTEDAVFRQEGHTEAPDGRSYDYYLETSDGVTADFSIDGEPYDLDQGTLFLVATRGSETMVQQLDRDLAALPATNEGIADFGQADPAVATFIQNAGGR